MELIKGGVREASFRMVRRKFETEYLEIASLSDKGALNEFTEQKRNQLFLHAYKHNSYYHRIFKQISLIQNEEVDPSKIPDIPILTKDIIRKNHTELISDDYQTRKWFYNSSGGSTGEPIRLVQDDVYLRWRNATNYYYYKNILGTEEPAVKKVLLWGSERDLFKGSIGFKAKIQNRLSNTVFLNSFRMTEQDIERYINTINSFKPEIVRGYAGSLYELCRYAERKKLPLYTPKIVVSAAESLSDMMRETIQSNFGTKVYNFYGSREVSNLAGECKEGLMHPFMFWNYQEVLDNHNQPVKEGEEGRVIVTNLFNYSMPLIRYEIGDMAILGPEKCSCGSILPTFKKITGRTTDHFVLKNGTTIHGEYFTHLFYLKDWVEKFQVIQEDYETVRILLVPSSEENQKDKKTIEAKIRLIMGSESKVVWDIVDDIPKTPSGKYLYTKSMVWR
jgi:phenylacetate-CoA ligase